jgi:GH15 family glucan-1,4-alpha-glucosidase
MARWQIARAVSLDGLKEGLNLLFWAVNHSQRSGLMAEQLDPITGATVSVSPLSWSHAEFVIAVYEYLSKYREITSAVDGMS